MVTPWDLLLSPSLRVTSGGDHRRPVQTCSFGDSAPPLPKQHLVVATEAEAQTVYKWAVCILLECCLIYSSRCCLI